MSTDHDPNPGDPIGTESPTLKAPPDRHDEPSSGAADGEAFVEPAVQPRPGDVLFDRYRVERLLGAGGMGSVWLVRHLALDVPRALKLIVSGVAFVPEAQSRFRREARAMARLSHPNAVVVHDFQVTRGSAFIEMEYVRGRGLGDFLRGVPMPLDWVARVLAQLCDVLQQAHDQGIVHRDLKPSNLMLLDDRPPGQEWVKVLDFGIAKVLEADADLHTSTGAFMGTAHYASPEQAMGWAVDARSDVYSLGVILYEMLVGCRPFDGPIQRQLYDHLNTPAPDFAKRNPRVTIPPEVEAIVLRCLAKTPDGRPGSTRELAAEFLRAAAGAVDLSGRPAAPADGPPYDPRPLTPPPTDRTQPPYRPVAPSPGGEARTADGQRIPYEAHQSPATLGPYYREPTAHPAGGWGGVATVPAPRRRSRRVVLAVIGLLGVATAVAIPLLRPKPVGPAPRGRSTLPEGFEAVDAADLVDGVPRALTRVGGAGSRFLRLPGGEFLMGDASGSEADEDRPAHPVVLSGYYLQETEVTNAEMEAYFRAERVAPKDRPKRWREAVEALEKAGRSPDKHPAVGIPHRMAEAYALWVGGCLPTEAQWEYAARSAGKPNPFVWGTQRGASDAANLNTLGDSAVPTTEVGVFAKDRTEQGLLDMAGNVREWCRDIWAYYEATEKAVRDPTGPAPRQGTGGPFVIRGGSFATFPDQIRTTRPRRPRLDRDGSKTEEQVAEDGSAADLGFRVAIEWPRG